MFSMSAADKSHRDGVKKQGFSHEDARRRRDEQQSIIRKNKREESLQKRRKEVKLEDTPIAASSTEQKLAMLPRYIAMAKGADSALQLEGVENIRRLLSIERNPPIQQCVDAGLVPRLVELLSYSEYPRLQYEAAWSLTNIASGSADHTHVVIRADAVPRLLALTMSPHMEVVEQAIWAIGNISGESPECRDFVLEQGGLVPLINALERPHAPDTLLRTGTWALSNYCRGKPQPKFAAVAPAVDVLKRLVQSTDEDLLVDACWALSYLTDGDNQRLETVIKAGITRRLVELLTHNNIAIQTPALRAVGNLVTGDDDLTAQVTAIKALFPALRQLLVSSKKGIKKEACWAVSNITAGTKVQVKAVIDAGIIDELVDVLTTADFDVRKEAAYAVSNATSLRVPDQIHFLVGAGILKPIVDLLSCDDVRVVLVCLEAIENIFKVASKDQKIFNRYLNIFEETQGLDEIEKLQSHGNEKVYDKAVKVLTKYLGASEEDDQNVAPTTNGQANLFQFGFVPQNGPTNFAF